MLFKDVAVVRIFVLLKVHEVLGTGAEADGCEKVIIDNEGLDDGVGNLNSRIWYIACNVGDFLWAR